MRKREGRYGSICVCMKARVHLGQCVYREMFRTKFAFIAMTVISHNAHQNTEKEGRGIDSTPLVHKLNNDVRVNLDKKKGEK